MYALKILDSYGYFALSEVFTTLLTSEFGVSDVRAGAYYGAWGTAIVLYGVLTGFLVDYLGVRTSLVCSYALQTLSRIVIAFPRDRASLFAVVFLLHPLASAWGAPVMTIAIKRLTSAADRTASRIAANAPPPRSSALSVSPRSAFASRLRRTSRPMASMASAAAATDREAVSDATRVASFAAMARRRSFARSFPRR